MIDDGKFLEWWESLEPYEHDKKLRWFPVGESGDKLAVSQIAMMAIWQSMSKYWR